MVDAEDSLNFQQRCSWHPPNVNHMSTVLSPGQKNCLPCSLNPGTLSTNVGFRGFSVSALPRLPTGQANGAHGLSQCLPPLVECSPAIASPYVKESPSALIHGLGIKTTPTDVTGSTKKRFVIFDQSGDQTRLFVSPFGSSFQKPIGAPMRHAHVCHLDHEEKTSIMEYIYPTKPLVEETSDENHVTEGGSEFHEDLEDIDALLYSDDDSEEEEEDRDGDEDDEVTSTGHSPFAVKRRFKDYEHVGEIVEVVASSDGSTKRQKLVDGGYRKLSLENAAGSTKSHRSCKYENDAESSCASGQTQGRGVGPIFVDKEWRKDKIHDTLKILESIIPGSKTKDPSVIIDEAIEYLKSLKLKAKVLGVNYP